MIKYKNQYEKFISDRGVGQNDCVADSVKSYVSYLESVSTIIGETISPLILACYEDVLTITEKIEGSRKANTIRNYMTAMKRYSEMVEALNLHEKGSKIMAKAWQKYNKANCRLARKLGRTNNLIGEYGEFLANQHLKGELLDISSQSADIEKEGKTYQVKARRLSKGTATQLGIIRSWDFDYLVVILFDKKGRVIFSNITPSVVAKEIAVENEYQNGYVITTNRNFMFSRHNEDITHELRVLNGELH